MPPRFLLRKVPIAVWLTAWRVWRRIPPDQRRELIKQVRIHGPRLAQAVATRRKRR